MLYGPEIFDWERQLYEVRYVLSSGIQSINATETFLWLNGHGSITNLYDSCVEMTSWGEGSLLSTRVSLAVLFANDVLLKRYSC